jgi:proteasome lid subunit RPN8/RPN11
MTAEFLPISDPEHTDQLIGTLGRKAQAVRDGERLRYGTKDSLINLCKNSKLELCGFITQREKIVLVTNVHGEPSHNFYMDHQSLKQALCEIYEENQDKILGIFHTHPNNQPWPSPRDIVGWPNIELGWRYFIVTNKEVLEWELV